MRLEFYQAVVDNLPIGVIVLQSKKHADNNTFCFTYANQASETLLGIPLHKMIDKPLAEVLPTAEAALPAVYHEVLRSGISHDLGDIYYCGDGIEGYFRVQVLPLAEDAILIVFNNITDQKRIEEERKQTELALEIYNRKLEASNRELEEFAYVASHDLQEPLRKILAFGDRLRSKYSAVLDEVGQDYLMRMQNAALRMQTLISDLLDLSRIGTRGQPFEPVDLSAIVADVLKDLETTIEEQSGTVVAGPLPTVFADALQMRQLFQNLIGNALKFHKPNSASVVKISSQFEDNDAAAHTMHSIFIADNGIGFDEKYLDRIFQPFQRLHGINQYEGTGMGLAICRRIAERHGGSITAQSQPDMGTTFMVTLPNLQPAAKETN